MKININSEKEPIQSFIDYLSYKRVDVAIEIEEALGKAVHVEALRRDPRYKLLSELIDDLLEQKNQNS